MTHCRITSYHGIPAIFQDFKAHADDLVHQKLEKRGDANPCKDVPADKYDDPDTRVACKKVAHELRFSAAKYLRRYVREEAAREMNSLYNGQMMARDEMRVAEIEARKLHDKYKGWLAYMWQGVASDWLGIGDASDYLDNIRSGKNLACIGAQNICAVIEDQTDKLEARLTAHTMPDRDGVPEERNFALLNPIHVLYKNKWDPDGCKVSFREFMGQVDGWMKSLEGRLVGMGLRPEPVEAPESEATTDAVEAPECPVCPPVPEEVMCTPKTQKTLIKKLKEKIAKCQETVNDCERDIGKINSALQAKKAQIQKLSATVSKAEFAESGKCEDKLAQCREGLQATMEVEGKRAIRAEVEADECKAELAALKSRGTAQSKPAPAKPKPKRKAANPFDGISIVD